MKTTLWVGPWAADLERPSVPWDGKDPEVRRSVDDVWLTARVMTLCRDLLTRIGTMLAEQGVAIDAIGDEEVIALPDGHLDIVVRVVGRDVFVARLPPEDWAWMAGKEPAA